MAFMLIKVLAPGYYARQDTATPVKIGIQAMVVNMVLNLILVFPLQHAGLALATSLSAYYNVWMLYRGLRKQGVYEHQQGWLGFGLKIFLANSALVALMLVLMGPAAQWLDWSAAQRAGWMTLIVVASVVMYFAILIAAGLRVRHLRGEVF
jgi:putative peptidoglycan lipid II flippase